jgi:hypothetical protein
MGHDWDSRDRGRGTGEVQLVDLTYYVRTLHCCLHAGHGQKHAAKVSTSALSGPSPWMEGVRLCGGSGTWEGVCAAVHGARRAG